MVKTISVNSLAKKVINREETFILDVRNTDEFVNWKIDGEKI